MLRRHRPIRRLAMAQVVLAVFVVAGTGSAFAANELYLVREGQPAGTIVIPQDTDPWTKQAAEWLQVYVEQSSGVRLQIVGEGQQADGVVVSVGHTRMAREAGIDVTGLKWDGCRLVVKGNTLFLLGRDSKPIGEGWTGGAPRGTCRAVVTFLEDFVGVRWFLPVPEGTLVPRRAAIAVPADLDKSVTPPFAFIHGRFPYGVNTPAAIANNFRTAVKILSYGGHSYYDWLPASKYFDEHPEYFALINGQRTARNNSLCSSNPQVRQILLDAIRRDFDAGWEWVALGQEDGYVPCECDECEKLDRYRQVMGPWQPRLGGERDGEDSEGRGAGPASFTSLAPQEEGWGEYIERFRTAPCERLAAMHLWIVDQCAQSHPDRKVHLLIYWPSLIPSANLDHKRENLVGEVAFYNDPHERDVMDLWKDNVYGLSVMVTWFDLTTGKATMGVMMTPQEVAKRMRVYHERGVIGLYGIHEANWGLQGPCYYVMGRISGNPALNDDRLLREYCDGVFRGAGPTMKRFFDLLYTRSISKLGYQWQVRTFGSAEDKHLLMYPMDFLRHLDAILTQAESEARAEPESVGKIMALTRRQLDLLRLTTRMLIAHRAHDANPSVANLDQLKRMVADYDEFRRDVLTHEDQYEQPWPGQSDYDWLCKYLVGDGDDGNYYKGWRTRKTEIDPSNLGAVAPGFSGSVIRAPWAAIRQAPAAP